MNRRRLDAESVHDAILLAAGRLDRTMGGPSVQQFALRPGVHVTPVVDYTAVRLGQPGLGRRSVYRFLFRTLPDPFMDTPRRGRRLAVDRGAQRVDHPAAGPGPAQQPVRAPPERAPGAAAGAESAGDSTTQVAAGVPAALRPPADAEELPSSGGYAARHGLANLCRLLFNSNEFLFVN